MSNAQIPGVIAQIKEDMEVVTKSIREWETRIESLEAKHDEEMGRYEAEARALRQQLRDMETTRRTLAEYEAGTFHAKTAWRKRVRDE